jgi:hypothetical protein
MLRAAVKLLGRQAKRQSRCRCTMMCRDAGGQSDAENQADGAEGSQEDC